MKFFLKKSFLLKFLLYFSATLIVLGVVQSIIGTMRLYNASEQSYEKLSPKKIYTAQPDTAPTLTPQTTLPESTSKEPIYEVANDKTSVQDILKETAPEKTQKIEESIPTISQTAPKKENVASKSTSLSKKRTSPVEISVTPEESSAPQGYRETIQTVVVGKYFRDTLWKFPIIIDTDRTEPRGQMYNESITLSSTMVSLTEVSKVLVHEIGHMIDIYTLRKNLRRSDPSEEFYKISWKDTTTIKAGVPQASFVSGYASTNQYEDFAESFAMYIFHNKEFLKRAEQNDFLKRKYNFLKTRIFGDIFIGSAYEKNPIPKKVWDVTKIAIRGNNVEIIFAWINTLKYYKS